MVEDQVCYASSKPVSMMNHLYMVFSLKKGQFGWIEWTAVMQMKFWKTVHQVDGVCTVAVTMTMLE